MTEENQKKWTPIPGIYNQSIFDEYNLYAIANADAVSAFFLFTI